MGTAATTVVIVDDHAALREALSQVLAREGFHVIGLAGAAQSAHDLILRRRPDVAVIDLRLAGESGTELVGRLLEALPELRVLVYTGEDLDGVTIERLFASGVTGIALKSGDSRELSEAVRATAAGRRYRDSRLSALEQPAAGSVSGLSEREKEILRLVGQGLTDKAIAATLQLSPHTVRSHVRNALRKLDVSTRAQAVLVLERSEARPRF